MDGSSTAFAPQRPHKRRFAGFAIAASLLLLAAPAGSALAEDAAPQPTSPEPFDPALAGTASVAEGFTALPDPSLQLEPEAGAVDITAFEPPIEIEPETTTRSLGMGHASYYGRRFHGRRTANGERFDMHAMTAAHKTLPFGTLVEVTNPRNGKTVTVRINDRGPFIRGRTIDLSRSAARKIGIIQRGHGAVELAIVE